MLSRHHCVLQLSEDTPNAVDAGSPLAEARWPLLSQAKVLISIHRDEQIALRLGLERVDAIHAGAVVVTEPSGGLAPLVADEHLWSRPAPTRFPISSRSCWATSNVSLACAPAAYERLKAWVPYALSVAVLRAAVVEFVGEPTPSQAAVGDLRYTPDAANVSRAPHAAGTR